MKEFYIHAPDTRYIPSIGLEGSGQGAVGDGDGSVVGEFTAEKMEQYHYYVTTE